MGQQEEEGVKLMMTSPYCWGGPSTEKAQEHRSCYYTSAASRREESIYKIVHESSRDLSSMIDPNLGNHPNCLLSHMKQ